MHTPSLGWQTGQQLPFLSTLSALLGHLMAGQAGGEQCVWPEWQEHCLQPSLQDSPSLCLTPLASAQWVGLCAGAAQMGQHSPGGVTCEPMWQERIGQVCLVHSMGRLELQVQLVQVSG